MIEFCLHPQIHSTGSSRGLIGMLERAWVREHTPGKGHLVVVSGFGNYNGGVRFYDVFRRHTANGGRMTAVLGGSTSQRLTSKEVVEKLLECGTDVHLVNRKRILHAKCYGTETDTENRLIVSSGNFTGPGMSQNIEGSVFLDAATTRAISFRWQETLTAIFKQRWNFYRPTLADRNGPAWRLLYDEAAGEVGLDQTEDVTMLLTLGHADTARIQAAPGSIEAKGTQYFWLSKDCYDFFPPLTILNTRGSKRTYSCIVTLEYPDIGVIDTNCRVTFEAENNLDFRLGTGPLRSTKYAREGDLAAITRIGHAAYQLRIFRARSAPFKILSPYAATFVGHQGKRYGTIANDEFATLISMSRVKAPR
jgi:hypothetical protein